nr:ribosome-interacting gtpase 2 [Quercus suber]
MLSPKRRPNSGAELKSPNWRPPHVIVNEYCSARECAKLRTSATFPLLYRRSRTTQVLVSREDGQHYREDQGVSEFIHLLIMAKRALTIGQDRGGDEKNAKYYYTLAYKVSRSADFMERIRQPNTTWVFLKENLPDFAHSFWSPVPAQEALVVLDSMSPNQVTKTKSEVAAYSFTTLTAIPGVLEYGGAEIQVLDLPGIIEGASEGKGRGRQVISAAKVQRRDQLLVKRALIFLPDKRYDIDGSRCDEASRAKSFARSRIGSGRDPSQPGAAQHLPQTEKGGRHENHLLRAPEESR